MRCGEACPDGSGTGHCCAKRMISNMRRLLFVCSRNRLSSPTAESVFAVWPDAETDSAGLATDADTVLSADQVEWADVIFVMEKVHRVKLTQRFRAQLSGKKVVCLDIPDDYEFMQAELVSLLEKRVRPHLP
jgi:predicted protein tyrosine phosphatase